MIDITKQICNYSVFKKESGHHQCKIKEQLTVVSILNPFDQILEDRFLCQSHSDLVLGYYIFSYEKLSKEIIEIKKLRSELYSQLGQLKSNPKKTYKDHNQIKSISTEMEVLVNSIRSKEKLKNRISYSQCRHCLAEISPNNDRIIISFTHPKGKDRHHLNICSSECLEKFKKKSGLENHTIKPLTNFA